MCKDLESGRGKEKGLKTVDKVFVDESQEQLPKEDIKEES
jgi:hypothetical protein